MWIVTYSEGSFKLEEEFEYEDEVPTHVAYLINYYGINGKIEIRWEK